jgi:hypothetical protein
MIPALPWSFVEMLASNADSHVWSEVICAELAIMAVAMGEITFHLMHHMLLVFFVMWWWSWWSVMSVTHSFELVCSAAKKAVNKHL